MKIVYYASILAGEVDPRELCIENEESDSEKNVQRTSTPQVNDHYKK